MAKIKLLIDTDILIDSLKGIKAAKDLLRTKEIDLFCSILSKKELLSKSGLRESERKRIVSLLSRMKVLRVDDDINRKYESLIKKYGENPDLIADYIIAATAWSKKLPLLTRNKKHFEHIQEITLTPSYDTD
ncbi:type II toxin-antitoxin system VapC family toxin [Candidatus Poribacteria bacterium]|nr:type II toxin-antitoxin system VapC family toxin [Candidatus Poribacteria bacterium]